MKDWDGLRFVLAIARSGGLSGAARDLGVTHATVSRQLDKIEAAMGARLFSRRPSGLLPTEAGRDVIAHAAQMERAVLAMDLALAARTQAGSGRLVVTAPPLIVASGLADDLKSFAAQNPGIEITLRASDSTLNLHKREADVSIRVSRDPEPSLWGRVLVPQRAAWCATQGFLDRHREGLAAAGQGVPILSFDSWPHPVPVTLSPVLPLAHVAMTVDDMISAVALAQTGVAMLRMPVFLTALHRDLRPVPGLAPVDYMPIWCLTHPDLRQVPHVRALMRHLADSFAARRGIYAGADPDG
jgi:DNA-binding transcriptional LysR family regulator